MWHGRPVRDFRHRRGRARQFRLCRCQRIAERIAAPYGFLHWGQRRIRCKGGLLQRLCLLRKFQRLQLLARGAQLVYQPSKTAGEQGEVGLDAHGGVGATGKQNEKTNMLRGAYLKRSLRS